MKKILAVVLITATLAAPVMAGKVTGNGVELRVHSKSWGKSNGAYSTAQSGHKYIFVEIELTNKGDGSVHCNPCRFQLTDRDGYAYDWVPASKGGLQVVDLQGGQKARGRLAFLVPFNAKAKELVFESGFREFVRIRL